MKTAPSATCRRRQTRSGARHVHGFGVAARRRGAAGRPTMPGATRLTRKQPVAANVAGCTGLRARSRRSNDAPRAALPRRRRRRARRAVGDTLVEPPGRPRGLPLSPTRRGGEAVVVHRPPSPRQQPPPDGRRRCLPPNCDDVARRHGARPRRCTGPCTSPAACRPPRRPLPQQRGAARPAGRAQTTEYRRRSRMHHAHDTRYELAVEEFGGPVHDAQLDLLQLELRQFGYLDARRSRGPSPIRLQDEGTASRVCPLSTSAARATRSPQHVAVRATSGGAPPTTPQVASTPPRRLRRRAGVAACWSARRAGGGEVRDRNRRRRDRVARLRRCAAESCSRCLRLSSPTARCAELLAQTAAIPPAYGRRAPTATGPAHRLAASTASRLFRSATAVAECRRRGGSSSTRLGADAARPPPPSAAENAGSASSCAPSARRHGRHQSKRSAKSLPPTRRHCRAAAARSAVAGFASSAAADAERGRRLPRRFGRRQVSEVRFSGDRRSCRASVATAEVSDQSAMATRR